VTRQPRPDPVAVESRRMLEQLWPDEARAAFADKPLPPEHEPRPQKRGKRLERMCAAPSPLVLLVRVEQGIRRFRKGGDWQQQSVKSPPDFYGCVIGTGRLVVFDAKETAHARHLDARPKIVKTHQKRQIVRAGRAGAVAGLLCLRTTDDALFWCPWPLLENETVTEIPWSAMRACGTVRRGIDWRLVLAAAGEGRAVA